MFGVGQHAAGRESKRLTVPEANVPWAEPARCGDRGRGPGADALGSVGRAGGAAHRQGHPSQDAAEPGWAIGYNAVALPIAAVVFEPAFGLMLRPEIAALSMSGSSLLVAVNALLLKRLSLPQPAEPPSTPADRVREPVVVDRA